MREKRGKEERGRRRSTAMATPPPPLPDWSEMQRDCLELIMRSIKKLPDGFAAAAVCKNWRAAAAPSFGSAMAPRRLLWLLTVPSRGGECSDAELYDVFNGVSHRTALPGVIKRGWKVSRSSRGWLFVVHGVDQRLSLANPFTGAHISLPNCPPGLDPVKAVVFADPSSGSYRVLLMTQSGEVCFTASEDKKWQLQRPDYDISDCISYCGRFLAVDVEGNVLELGADFLPQMIIPAPWRDSNATIHEFLLAAPWGDILLVRMRLHYQGWWKPAEFEVFIVNLTEKTLERTEDLHDHAIILDSKHCSLVSVDCQKALPSDTIIYLCIRFPLRDRGLECPFMLTIQTNMGGGVYNLRNQSFLPVPPSLQPPGGSLTSSMLVIPPSHWEHD